MTFPNLEREEGDFNLLSVHHILLCSSVQLGEVQTSAEPAMREDMD